ncbi:MAG: amidohydrolase family protein [Microcella sp.]|uniref:amidohydrolase family protein n=1 Tax=Microcella sp. TaxID=1913979 RepID=UPI003314B3B0
MSVPVLDAHFHVWDTARVSYPWVEAAQAQPQWFLGGRKLPRKYLLEDYQREWSPLNVEPFVHVEAGAAPESSVAETEFLTDELDRGTPMRKVVSAGLTRRDLEDVLAAHQAHAGVVGVRDIVTWDLDGRYSFVADDLLSREDWRSGLRVLERLDLSFDMQILPSQVQAAVILAGQFPSLRFVVNHAGLPHFANNDQSALWRSSLVALGAHENIAIKAGGFSMMNNELTSAIVEDALWQMLDAFGPRRVMVGTNSPVESTRHSPHVFIDGLNRFLGSLAPLESAAIAAENVTEWYRSGTL